LNTALDSPQVNAIALLSVLTFVWIWGYVYGVMPRERRVHYWVATILVALACGVFVFNAGSK
jgi:CHASE2 domain-containing sensor protein